MSALKQKKNRRELIQTIAGLGATLLAYQHCAPAKFSARKDPIIVNPPTGEDTPVDVSETSDCRPSGLPFDYPYFDKFEKINGHDFATQADPGSFSSVASEHKLNLGFWHIDHYDQSTNSSNVRKYMLTVDVGNNPSSGQFHQSANQGTDNNISDIYVFNDTRVFETNGNISGNLELLHWKRLGANESQPSAFFILSNSIVTNKSKLYVVARCTSHGFWAELLNLSQVNSTSYSQAVPQAVSTMKFAGTSIYRPYVAGFANGGQNIVGADIIQHTPSINVIDNNTVEVFMGSSSSKHPPIGTAGNHYISGALLYDQDGNRIGQHSLLNLSRATNTHVFRFNNLNLTQRGVRTLVAICQDTFNGNFIGFKT